LVIVWFATGTGGEWSEAMGRAIALSMSTSNNNQKNLTMATSIEENRPQGSEPESIFKGMLDHVCIRVADIDLSIEFYRKAFGYKVKGRWNGQTIGEGENAKTVPGIGAMIEDEAGGVIELILDQNTGDRQANQRPINHFAIRINEVETGYKQALEAGAVSIMPPTTISTKISKLKTAFVFGPDGERIEIINYDNQ